MIIFFLVFILGSFVLCKDNDDKGKEYTTTCYPNVDKCKKKQDKLPQKTKYKEKCTQVADGPHGFAYTMCLNHNQIRYYSSCDAQCKKCSTKQDFGKCKSQFAGGPGCKVEGCGMGYTAETLMALGGVTIFLGICGCLCCAWLCLVPFGIFLICVGFCFAYC